MSEPTGRADFWRLPAFVLWLVLFGAGLFPEPLFEWLRTVGVVLTWDALTNSPYAITLALSCYFVVFSFNRCRDVDVPDVAAYGNALQNGIVGLVAFLPFPFDMLLKAHEVLPTSSEAFIYGIAALKMIAWFYLFRLIVQYYLFGVRLAFAQEFSIFPSLHARR